MHPFLANSASTSTPAWGTVLAWLTVFSGWIYFVFIISLVIMVLLRKREPSEALGWSLAIVFLPLIGPLFFLLFGITRVPRRLRRKLAHREAYGSTFELPDSFYEREKPFRTGYPSNHWGKLGQMLESLGETPRHGGNDVTFYNEGRDAFEEAARVIDAAEHHIHIELFILRQDKVGKRLIQRLIEKIRQGVEVRLIVDAMGSPASWRTVNAIRRAGGEAATFSLLLTHRFTPNLRTHRKLIVCDGQTAFFGGMNVGTEYLGRRGAHGRDWYDLAVRIRGPAVWDLQLMFLEDWDFASGKFLDDLAYFPQPIGTADAPVQIITGGPDAQPNPIRKAFFGAFTQAEKRIVVSTPTWYPTWHFARRS